MFFGACSENHNDTNPISSELELLSINEVSLPENANGRIQEDAIEFMKLEVRLNDDKFEGIAVLLEATQERSKIGLLGNEHQLVAYVEVYNISDNLISAKYYTADDQLYMETSMENNILTFQEFYSIETSVSNGRINGWFDDFGDCVEDFATTVADDAVLSGAYVIGAICCPHYIVAGLGLGCAISATVK